MTTTLTPDLLDRAVSVLSQLGPDTSDYDLNPDFKLPGGRKLRQAGVLILLSRSADSWQVTLTKRSSALKHHPGQIAFPGGKQDPQDTDIEATALREAREEIGLPQEHVRMLGRLPQHETVTGFVVTPVIAVLEQAFTICAEPSEVDEVFTVPLSHVLDPANFTVEARNWQGRVRHYYTVPYGPYYIWGATARILRVWADALAA